MFPWHSTVVQPANIGRPTNADPSTAPAGATGPTAADPSATPAQRIIETAYRSLVEAGAGLERDELNRIVDPSPLQRALAVDGVRLGPEGFGTLLALCDRVPIRPPTLEEFSRCCLRPGAVIGPPGPPPGAAGRGRGLGHLCSSATQSTASRGRGRAGPAAAASMGATRGRGAAARASMGASRGRGRG